MKKNQIYKTQQGYSLIELMMVVAIVGILAKIAIPSYSSYIQKSQRTAATTALLDLASREAQYYSTNNAYTSVMTSLGYANATTNPIPSASSHLYDLTLVATATTFTGTATRVTGSSQATDSCGTYSINNLGVQSPTTSGCW